MESMKHSEIRIKMPMAFGAEPMKEKSAWDLSVEEQMAKRNPDLSVPHVFVLALREGEVFSSHRTKEGAYAKAAQLIMKGYMLHDLEGIEEEFETEECDCLCHNECQCDGDHDPETPECFFEDCASGDSQCASCFEKFNGKELEVELREMFRQERYEALVTEWNSFWLRYHEYNNAEDGERHDGLVFDVGYRLILP